MNIEIVHAHAEYFAICEMQNDLTGNWIYQLRKIPYEGNSNGEYNIRVDGKTIDVRNLLYEFKERERETREKLRGTK